MGKYTVFFINIDADLVNRHGWDGSPEAIAYLKATIPADDDQANYKDAVLHGLYTKAAIVTVNWDDNELVWSLMQNLQIAWKNRPECECLTNTPRSMMVGDILYDHGHATFHAVAAFGFVKVTDPDTVSKLVGLLA